MKRRRIGRRRKTFIRFCEYCGTKISNAMSNQKICPECKGKIQAEEEMKRINIKSQMIR